MDRLPLETLHQIFELACTDGGYTGCALALTSKFIHDTAQSTRFHSVVLEAEPRRLGAFIAVYQNQYSNAADIRPRTCHLHLLLPSTTKARPPSEPTEEDESGEESEDEEKDESGEESEDEEKDESTSHSQSSLLAAQLLSVQQLLSLISNDLQSLVINKHNLEALYPLFNRPFPALQELTLLLHGNLSHLIAPDPNSNPLFPALTHLHIVAPDWSPPLLPTWILHAPRVTHLRISAHDLFGKFVNELPDALGTPQCPVRGLGPVVGPPPAVRTYPTLARVVVQPGPRPPAGPCGTSRHVFNWRTMQLEWIAERAKTAGVGMRVLPACSWENKEWDEAIRTEWLKRIGGGPGRDWFCGADEEDEDAK
ncbi:hypothetical protein GSI_03578 [Ganoderma sinense ZZ0214-1]|uniref:F-box domain-containing protein n=1 Tax=Ganoderma sinense ZZ0214-1 TaxID=1077348 RepID=A0A2G8SJD0_9APHY|nr:hypothetical protein GSI_03578 [Ganoderma sinense ZZ0214-1]